MLLNEIAKKKGTYAGVKFDKSTVDKLVKYMKAAGIPSPSSKDDLHTTLLYSRTECPDYEPDVNCQYIGTPSGFEKFGDDKNTLVLAFDCPELAKRHSQLRKEHGATWDYPSYIPHITLSYDAADVDISKLPDISDFIDKVVCSSEYKEDLNLDWENDH